MGESPWATRPSSWLISDYFEWVAIQPGRRVPGQNVPDDESQLREKEVGEHRSHWCRGGAAESTRCHGGEEQDRWIRRRQSIRAGGQRGLSLECGDSGRSGLPQREARLFLLHLQPSSLRISQEPVFEGVGTKYQEGRMELLFLRVTEGISEIELNFMQFST